MSTPLTSSPLTALTRFHAITEAPFFSPDELVEAANRVREPCVIVQHPESGEVGVAFGGVVDENGAYPVLGALPALYPEWLGDRSFCEVHGTRFPYVIGAMANGIASTDLVIAGAQEGILGFFGSAGLGPDRVEKAAHTLHEALDPIGQTFGMNLIHSPHEPDLENRIVDLYHQLEITRVSASAYMDLTPMVVRYALKGLGVDSAGNITRKNHLFAKISRPEVAGRFMRPAPAGMLADLVAKGQLTQEEANLAAHVPVAEDITVESDSGGHTDNQILTAVFPTVVRTHDDILREYTYSRPIRIGAAGGLGTPDAVAAAFSLGAAYVLTGSVNQSAIESGLSPRGKELLAKAAIDDVMMAPAADMFEMGVKVQVLQRGAMFGVRAHKLYDVYRKYDGLEFIPADEKARLEKDIFKDSLENVWRATQDFFAQRDPRENVKAENDPKHRMALVFRSYLGQSSRWAIAGDEKRALDFQIWCGPAMGAFNAWTKDSFLERPENRTAVQIAKNLLEGATVITRAGQLRTYGVPMPERAFQFPPRPLA
jgi:trans-AT polyketide synthase/acyltransferase/oxidoreductase domain-containing protein